ncbi:Na(+)/H(+) exchange regulatory cofactor NHE-RF3 isoform X3 [Pristis pectinata]|uniref:Na(+)/H(+) exchange regulatory cofactor NHE-RF3 isoform X3 n=1 Tax=Pristis pectinata TaxID=685728 RepID=UPI00223E0383|nr:Na(+)/H(+) exchange regulatory cofactor NHE-RF3 isoform X3 [Pristis pectinata]
MVMPPQPRVCQLSKKEGGSYGFFLRIEKDVKGHLIRAVVKEGPADRVGLQDGDRVLRVNGVFVDTEDHQRVVELIKKSGTSVSLTVLDGDSYVNSKKQGIDLLQLSCVDSGPNKPVVNGVSGKTHRPRLCYLLKQEHGFGFSLKTITGVPGLFMTDISPHGAAFIAGVQPNDRILQLNGENVENFTHEQMVTQMKSSGINMVLLLIDEASDKYFKSRALPVVASMASVNGLPYKPRIVELTKEAQGYGFFLRMEQGHQGIGHYIRAIDPNSPAEKAGLVDGDLLVAVNGTGVEHLEHESVVDMIKKCGNKTTFLVVDNATNQLYKQVVKGSPASEAGLEVNDVLIQVNGVNVEVDTHHELVERINSCRDQLSLLVVRKEENEHVKASEMPMSPLVIPEAMPEPISPPSDIQEDSRVEEAAEKKPEADEPTQKMGEQDESSSSSSAEGDSDDVTQM